MGFLELPSEPGLYSRILAGVAIKNFCLFSDLGHLSSYYGHLRNLNSALQTIRTILDVRPETDVHFLFVIVILRFLAIFKKSQASSPFKALNSVCLSRCQWDVRSPVQMRQRPTAFPRV